MQLDSEVAPPYPALQQYLSVRRTQSVSAWAAGYHLRIAEMLAKDKADVAAAEDLTERERAIAALAARGFSNKEIAATLAVGVRTVESHLQRAYGKLGIKSRWQIPPNLSERT